MFSVSQWIHKTAYGRIFTQFTTALYFGSQIYSYASSCENSSSRSSSRQEMGKIVEIFGVEHDESQKERGDRWSEDVGRKSSSCIINVHLTSEECKAPKILRSSCTPRRHCERWFWILCSIYWTRIISIINDSGKVMDIMSRLPGYDGEAADAVSVYRQHLKWPVFAM